MRTRIRKLFDPGSGMEKFESMIRDKHQGAATLLLYSHKAHKIGNTFLLPLPVH
jgi:hypothetical protein